jgi:hypothetical protein
MLVAAQVAVTLLLVTVAALLLNSFNRLRMVDIGIDTENVVTFALQGTVAAGSRTHTGEYSRISDDVFARLQSHPDVRAAALRDRHDLPHDRSSRLCAMPGRARVGTMASAAVVGLMRSLLFEVSPWDPATLCDGCDSRRSRWPLRVLDSCRSGQSCRSSRRSEVRMSVSKTLTAPS